MDLGLQGKLVWITGASGGIGRAAAELFAGEGARLALQAHRGGPALRAWLAGRPWGERAVVHETDVRDGDALEEAARELEERFGRIDACVVNAGVWPAEDLPLHALEPARLRDTLEVNLLGALWTARAFLGSLARTGPRADGDGASLTFTGSTAGRFGEKHHVDYAASKAALSGCVLTLKNEIVELDPRGRVNLVEPGWTVTPMARPALEDPAAVERAARTMALRRLATPEDVARTIVWLSSPRAATHLTGQTVTCAGGMEGRLLWGSDQVDAQAILDATERGS